MFIKPCYYNMFAHCYSLQFVYIKEKPEFNDQDEETLSFQKEEYASFFDGWLTYAGRDINVFEWRFYCTKEFYDLSRELSSLRPTGWHYYNINDQDSL